MPLWNFLRQRRIFSGCLTFADTYPCGRHSANEAVVMKPFYFATRVQKLQPYLAHSALSRLLMRHTFAKPTQPQNNDPATRLFMVPTQQPQNNDLATGFFKHATAKQRSRNQAFHGPDAATAKQRPRNRVFHDPDATRNRKTTTPQPGKSCTYLAEPMLKQNVGVGSLRQCFIDSVKNS